MSDSNKTRVLTPTGRTVLVRVRPVGQAHGCVGQIVSRNGRVLWEGPTRPRGFHDAALRDARERAEVMRDDVTT